MIRLLLAKNSATSKKCSALLVALLVAFSAYIDANESRSEWVAAKKALEIFFSFSEFRIFVYLLSNVELKCDALFVCIVV